MQEMAPLVDVRDLSVRFAAGPTVVDAVKNISFSVAKGEIVALVGESGSGKTVSALSILRLLPPEAHLLGGRILFAGHDLLTLPEAEMRAVRGRSISMITSKNR